MATLHAGGEKGPGQIDSDVSIPRLLQQLDEWQGDEDRRHLREQINRTEALLGRCNKLADLIVVGDVEGLRETGSWIGGWRAPPTPLAQQAPLPLPGLRRWLCQLP